ncbi:MAG TPA: sulfatase [Gemmatimonadaceae bacterium]
MPDVVSEPVAPSSLARLRDVLILVAVAALGAGLAEAGLRFALLPHRELLGNRIYLNPQSVWMGPLINAALFVVPVVATFLVARRIGSGRTAYPAAVLVAAFLSIYAVSMITRRLSDWALAALALGIAFQLARFASKRPSLAGTLARRTAGALGAVCLAVTVWVATRPGVQERRVTASLPAAAEGVPNVLLLVLDTVRGLELGFAGYVLPTTPNIDRWASRGIVFDRAIAPSPWTLPTHASLFTGAWPHELGVGWTRPFGTEHTTIAERLNTLGYATGGFVANLVYCSYLFGLQRGFATYRDYRFSPSELVGSSTIGRRLIEVWNRVHGTYVVAGRKSAADVNEEVLGWQESLDPERPWFAFVNYFDAHDPYDAEAPWRTRFPGTSEKWRSLFNLRVRPPDELAALQAAYDGSIAYLDDQVGRLLEELERRGALDNTLVIITSDHGEEFGEHGHTGHGSSLYTPVIHVPLVMIPPSGAPPRRVARFVSLRDVAATIEQAASPALRVMPGTPLQPLWTGDSLVIASPALSEVDRFATLPARYPISRANIRSLIVDDRWHLIRPDEGPLELYDLANDFMERANLAGSAGHAPIVKRLSDSLSVLVRQ